MTENTYELARAAYGELTQRSFADPQSATAALTKLSQFFPVCAPGGTTQVAEVAAGHKVLITAHVPQMCDDQGNGGDVFKERSSGTICFRAAFLKKLAGGIGLEWIPSETRTSFPFAGHAQGGWCCTVVVAARYRDWSGEWRVVSASKTLDLRDEAEPKGTPKQIARERGDIASRAETMAKSRCIADACIARTIAMEQVGAPIVCAKLYRTEPMDANAARDAMYGPPREIIDHGTGEVIDSVQGNHGAGPSSAPNAPAGSPPRESVASSGSAGTPPASASPAPSAAKEHEIPKRVRADGTQFPDAGKTFAEASTDALQTYLEDAMALIGKGGIPEKHMVSAKAKAKACADEIDRRREAEWQ